MKNLKLFPLIFIISISLPSTIFSQQINIRINQNKENFDGNNRILPNI